MQSCGFVAILLVANLALVLTAETTTTATSAVTTPGAVAADTNATSTAANESSTAANDQMNDAPQAMTTPRVAPTRVTSSKPASQPALDHTNPPVTTTPSKNSMSNSLGGSPNANIKGKDNGALRVNSGLALLASVVLAALVMS